MTTANISISLPLEVLQSIDQKRGTIPRSRFVAQILANSVSDEEEGASGAPSASKSAPDSKEADSL